VSRKVFIALALLVVLAGMGVVVLGVRTRSKGQDHLRQVLARQASRGYGDSLDDLIAAAPRIDAARQQRCWEWIQARAKLPSSYSKPLDETWYLASAAHPPEEDREWAEALRPVMEDLRGILSAGPVCFTSLGWIRQDKERLAASRVSERRLRLAHLLRLREAHRWFAFEAMTTEDPRPALDALDALGVALSDPGCLIDAMIAGACASMRDRAYARLALRGELPEERLEAWVGEPARGTSWVADAWRGERLLYWAPLGQDLLAGSSIGDHFDDQGGVAAWLYGASDCALFLEFLEANEGHMRGTVDVSEVRHVSDRIGSLGLPYDLAVANRAAMYMVSVRWRAEHRLVRLGVLVALVAHESRSVPNTEAEARAWMGSRAVLMDAGAWDVALKYERLGDKCCRIAVDPKSPLPAIFEETSAAAQVLQSPLGAPPGNRVLQAGGGGFEFQLP
jgi:hypothetical protein